MAEGLDFNSQLLALLDDFGEDVSLCGVSIEDLEVVSSEDISCWFPPQTVYLSFLAYQHASEVKNPFFIIANHFLHFFFSLHLNLPLQELFRKNPPD